MEQVDTRSLLVVLVVLALGCAAQAAPARDGSTACPGPPIVFEPLAADLWLIPARAEVADADNRGQVVNLLLARQGARVWLLGSGPSPAFGRALACQAQQRLGLRVTDLAVPRARAELALGAAGLPAARAWTTPAVRDAMRVQCPTCVRHLRQRMGSAALDLAAQPVRLPEHSLHGSHGSWGPFEWRQWRLDRSTVTTVWRHRGADVVAGFGVLWFGAPPDGRDTDIDRLARTVASVLDHTTPATRFVGEQGSVGRRDAVQHQLAYWNLILSQAAVGVARGDTLAAAPLPADVDWAAHERHGLNWQRAWRQAEDRFLALPAPRRSP